MSTFEEPFMNRFSLTLVGTVLALALASAASAQMTPPRPDPLKEGTPAPRKPTPEEQKKIDDIRAFWANVRKEDALPDDLKGQAVSLPVSQQAPAFRACLYVPTTFSHGRTWPLLVECTSKGASPLMLYELAPMAEKHESLLLVVEFTFAQGRATDQQSGWTREGQKEFTNYEVPIPEMLKNMAEDEKNLQALLKQVAAKYAVEPKAVGVTGFLWTGLMAYWLPATRPEQFCCGIARTGAFSDAVMPKDIIRARNIPFYIVSGDKEPEWASQAGLQAVAYFKEHQFTKVVVEKIPNSGVDPRPEIAANYFRDAVEKALSPEQMAFYRVFSKAVRAVEGLPAAGDVAATERSAKAPAQAAPAPTPPAAKPKADQDEDDEEALLAKRKPAATPAKPIAPAPLPPPTVDEALAAIKAFSQQYPKSAFRPALDFAAARLTFEKLGDRQKADQMLRPFLRPPLAADPVAPTALLYLAEKVIDRATAAQDAANVLNAIIARRSSPPEDVRRATELRKEILSAKTN
jgi:poly(3-hydroxybutyrate) depolymerase